MQKTRQSAMKVVEQYYLTGRPCKRGHIVKRLTISGACTECLSLNQQQYAETEKRQRKLFAQKLREKQCVVA